VEEWQKVLEHLNKRIHQTHPYLSLLRLFKNYKKLTVQFIGGEDGMNLQSFLLQTNFCYTTLKTILTSSEPYCPVSAMGAEFGLYGVGNPIGGLTLTFANGALIQPYTSLKRRINGLLPRYLMV
jgi:hypothetical protein